VDGDRAAATGPRPASPTASSSTLRPAQETLAELLRKHGAGSFDFAFIDADKTGYDAYYEACLSLLRAGGLIAIDNVLWSGTVADPADQKPDTVALRNLTVKIRNDPRVDACPRQRRRRRNARTEALTSLTPG
jgi:predicted O-methyltransferase YrrM